MRRTLNHIDYNSNSIELARFAKALGHPVRIEILKFLEKQSCCFTGDIVDVFPLAQSTISQHLKELKEAGLIQGEVKPPKVKYCIHQENWQKVKQLLDNLFNEIPHNTKSCNN